ncbi:hypothetical protein TL16_g03496 [Triparma laevis f. inornata]|uniref:Uncharacterized protein n=1 Tax=Triparma laevis f. inornata TaxID=1714386 RepID=A0A9W6ZY66_9STRA|nr:hypothetical protein TL16_g03496 [Triparma laevis f. inornata]
MLSSAVEDVTATTTSSTTDIQAFFDGYVESFTAGKVEYLATEFYRAPVKGSMVTPDGICMRMELETPEDVAGIFHAKYEEMKIRGYEGKSIMEPVKVVPMTTTTVLVQSKGIRYKGTGDEVLEHINANYIAEKFDDVGFRFTGIFAQVELPEE